LALNRSLQPLAVAKYGGVELDVPEFTHFQDNKKTDYIAKFPGGKIPAFEGKDGFLLTETIAVTKYSESVLASSLA
jgi:elongation factor 1-gamma